MNKQGQILCLSINYLKKYHILTLPKNWGTSKPLFMNICVVCHMQSYLHSSSQLHCNAFSLRLCEDLKAASPAPEKILLYLNVISGYLHSTVSPKLYTKCIKYLFQLRIAQAKDCTQNWKASLVPKDYLSRPFPITNNILIVVRKCITVNSIMMSATHPNIIVEVTCTQKRLQNEG